MREDADQVARLVLGEMPRPRTLEESVTDALRSAILRGVFRPGEPLPQGQLAEMLGVSRIPLRDALRRLEREGLVTIDGRRGARVSSLGPADVAEIYELRLLLEPAAIRHVIESVGDATVARLIHLADEMDAAAGDPVEGWRTRRAFYGELYRHCGRPRMRSMIMQLRDAVDRYHRLTGPDSHHAHSAIRDCLRERDADRAAAVIRAHLEQTRDDFLRSLEHDAAAGHEAAT